jgi:hypothetical protein
VQASEIPWVNTFHHYIMPIALIVDWLIQPPSSRLTAKNVLVWFGLPIAYLTYTLIRGALTNFYPYGFLSPDIQHGYGGVALYCGVMLVGFLIIGFVIVWISHWLQKMRFYKALYGTAFA